MASEWIVGEIIPQSSLLFRQLIFGDVIQNYPLLLSSAHYPQSRPKKCMHIMQETHRTAKKAPPLRLELIALRNVNHDPSVLAIRCIIERSPLFKNPRGNSKVFHESILTNGSGVILDELI
jgi:hypothetical protein